MNVRVDKTPRRFISSLFNFIFAIKIKSPRMPVDNSELSAALVDAAASAFFYGLDELFARKSPLIPVEESNRGAKRREPENAGVEGDNDDDNDNDSSDAESDSEPEEAPQRSIVNSDDDESLADEERNYTGEWERNGGAMASSLRRMTQDNVLESRLKSKYKKTIAAKPWLPTGKTALDKDLEKTMGIPGVLSHRQREKLKKINRPDTAGSKWFHLPAQEMTPEMTNELTVLQLQTLMHRNKFIKNKTEELPKHFHVGVVEASQAEFYRNKTRKERNKSFVDQALERAQDEEWVAKKAASLKEKDLAPIRPRGYKKKRRKV